MRKISIKNFLLGIIGMLAGVSATAQTAAPAAPKLTMYDWQDNSCIVKLSDNGKWAVSYGSASSNSSEWSNARLVNTATGEVTALGLEGDEATPLFCMAGDVTDDGMVVGMYQSKPAVWTKEKGWQTLPLMPGWTTGQLESVTPDGKYAVGKAYNYGGGAEGWREEPLMYDLTTMELMELTGLPTTGSAGEEYTMSRLTDITADGRYISGCVDYSNTWNTMYFIYDRQTGTYGKSGFYPDGTPWLEDIQTASGVFSPNGKWYGGTAYVTTGSEYAVPFLYNMETKETKIFDETNAQGYECIQVGDDGTIYASRAYTGPIRNLYVLVDGYWFAFDKLLKQRYGYDYNGQTGEDYTGTCMGVSSDGKVLTAFPDPYKSYVIVMNETFADAARGIDMLADYTVTPSDGIKITILKNFDITFNYDIQVLGTNTDVTVKDSQGNLVMNPLASGGFLVSASDSKTLHLGFRTTTLTEGEEYTLTIPAGTIAVSTDRTRTNEEIVIHFTGRKNAPVEVVSVNPENGQTLAQINMTTNPIILTYDTEVQLAKEGVTASVYRDNEETPVGSLDLYAGTTSSTKNQIMAAPASALYLYKGSSYRVVIPAGAVRDTNGDNVTTEDYTINYEGAYERVIESDDVTIYSEDFTNGVGNMLLRDGDGLTPNEEMQGYNFQAGDSYAWVPVRDSESSDFAAASTSAYDPAGQADDWMVTPQIYIPDEKCRLDFDAQGFRRAKQDKLKVIVYADDAVYNYLNKELCDKMLANGEVLMDERVSPGISETNLADDWETYSYKLTKYSGKNIYVAFVNENEDQSLVIVDNISIVHDTGFLTALTSETTVVNKSSVPVTGRITANVPNVTFNSITVKLMDADKKVVDTYTKDGLSLSKGDAHDFSFSKELPLTVGKANEFYIGVELGEYSDEVKYTVKDLAFETTKRVIIEENTGANCHFCPLGHQAWDYIENIYNDKVIMAAYHGYTQTDRLERGMTSYATSFLGCSGAPIAKINRGDIESSPMVNNTVDGKIVYTYTNATDCWLDLIGKEFEKLADADLSITASYDAASKKISVPYTATFAVSMDKQNIGLFLIVTEDNITYYQLNAFGTNTTEQYSGIEDWLVGGKYEGSQVVFIHNNVASAHVGDSYYGTTGLIPSTVENNTPYTGTITFDLPSTVSDIHNCNVICMMIDANTGKVINNAKAKILDPTGINGVDADAAGAEEVARYNAAGQMISAPQKGLNIIKYSDGTTRKVIVK